VVFGALLGVLLASGAASAQIAVGLSPALIDRSFEPGRAWAEEVSVRNNTNHLLRFKAYVQDVWYDMQNQVTFEDANTAPRSAASWVAIIPQELAVPAGEARTASVLITAPAEARGGYYAVAFFESEAGTERARRAEIKHTVRLGSVLLLHSVGSESYKVEIPKMNATPRSGGAGVDFELQVKNEGNTHIYTEGVVAILDGANHLVGKTRLVRKPILPGQTRPTEGSWVRRLAPGHYYAVVTIPVGEKDVAMRDVSFEVAPAGAK